MRRVPFGAKGATPFDPASVLDATEWARWNARATEATELMRDWFDACAKAPTPAQRPPQPGFREGVWSDLKRMILPTFRKRCAYCESKATVSGFGHAEHFRPKGAVTVQGKRVEEQGEQHPGYAWLAYDPHNLVPACERCNLAKGDTFPVAKSHQLRPTSGCTTSEELQQVEDPLLLHPYFDEPREHLEFHDDGSVTPRLGSAKGKATIEVMKLDHADLCDDRREAQHHAWVQIERDCERATAPSSAFDAIKATIARCEAGDVEYSAAVHAYLARKLNALIAEWLLLVDEARKLSS